MALASFAGEWELGNAKLIDWAKPPLPSLPQDCGPTFLPSAWSILSQTLV